MKRRGPPSDLWLAPRRPRWLLGLLMALAANCTGTGSSCTTDDSCPTGLVCTSHGRCEPPPPPPAPRVPDDEPVISWEDERHAA